MIWECINCTFCSIVTALKVSKLKYILQLLSQLFLNVSMYLIVFLLVKKKTKKLPSKVFIFKMINIYIDLEKKSDSKITDGTLSLPV